MMPGPLNAAEFRPIAFMSSAGPTSMGTSDCRVGASNVKAIAETAASTTTCQILTRWVCAKIASAKADSASTNWLAMRSLRRSTRSAIAPATPDSKTTGIDRTKPMMPR